MTVEVVGCCCGGTGPCCGPNAIVAIGSLPSMPYKIQCNGNFYGLDSGLQDLSSGRYEKIPVVGNGSEPAGSALVNCGATQVQRCFGYADTGGPFGPSCDPPYLTCGLGNGDWSAFSSWGVAVRRTAAGHPLGPYAYEIGLVHSWYPNVSPFTVGQQPLLISVTATFFAFGSSQCCKGRTSQPLGYSYVNAIGQTRVSGVAWSFVQQPPTYVVAWPPPTSSGVPSVSFGGTGAGVVTLV